MSMFKAVDVLASGLSVARARMNALASNIANAETTRTPDGGPYKRLDVLQVAKPISSKFHSALDRMTLHRPSVQAVVEDGKEPRLVYQPGHPDANEEGYVAYPNVNVVSTMTDMMSVSRLYQANIAAIETSKKMEQEASRISVRF